MALKLNEACVRFHIELTNITKASPISQQNAVYGFNRDCYCSLYLKVLVNFSPEKMKYQTFSINISRYLQHEKTHPNMTFFLGYCMYPYLVIQIILEEDVRIFCACY
jgi:hypothetical protein